MKQSPSNVLLYRLLAALILATASLPLAAQEEIWVHTPIDSAETYTQLIPTGDSRALVSHYVIDFSSGSATLGLTLLDAGGTRLWNRPLEAAQEVYLLTGQPSPTGWNLVGYAIVAQKRSLWVGAIDLQGNLTRDTLYPEINPYLASIGSDGTILVLQGGMELNITTIEPGSTPALRPLEVPVGLKIEPGDIRQLRPLDDGGWLIAGQYIETGTFEHPMIWRIDREGKSIEFTPLGPTRRGRLTTLRRMNDGSFAAALLLYSPQVTDYRSALVAIDPAGDTLWSQALDSLGNGSLTPIAVQDDRILSLWNRTGEPEVVATAVNAEGILILHRRQPIGPEGDPGWYSNTWDVQSDPDGFYLMGTSDSGSWLRRYTIQTTGVEGLRVMEFELDLSSR